MQFEGKICILYTELLKNYYCTCRSADTLLNVFLAIAVDNLASAQELTAAEEERKLEEEVCLCHLLFS